ncbi:MAG: NUDIX domain-containing protein [Candidatus Magasanikbacteria bacterium]|jgi:8-oxo-dGTP diphosphatase|nr:NUDIX domain-containing protein [Candidatus Magasanikbacteria bacterium]MBT4071731.1 NUDIX domain-containing protein [Candidatus Magasanikbacteria bacterium]
MKKERLKIIPGIYLVLFKENDVLLLRRYNTGYEDGNYSLVGGHLDDNESYENAIIREAKEEAGIDLESKDIKALHVLHRNQDGNRIDIFFTASKWVGEPKTMEPEKCDDVSWFPIDNLPTNIIPFIKQALEKSKEKTLYSDFGF